MTCLTMDRGLQENARRELEEVSAALAGKKEMCIRSGNSGAANDLLVSELYVASLRRELGMWLQLKDEEYDSAWDDLVMAQRTLSEACQVARQQGLPQEDHLAVRLERLEAIEQCVFPPQTFVSLGARVQSLKCSVCGRDYDDCEEHIAGRAYDGELCCLVTVGPLRADHVALVANPEDKRCRATDVSVDGFLRNTMTGRKGSEAPSGYAKMILAVASDRE